MRLGAAVSAFTSSDGEKWSWIDTESLDADEAVYIGLAVCSHDNSKLGTASFDQVTLSAPPPKTETQLAAAGSGDGLRANYFDATTGRIVSRIDANVNFDWDIDSPAEGIGPDFFSARWEGFLEGRSTDLYRLHVWSDDGARLWLDDQLLIDGWSDHGGLEQSAIVSLEAGRRYALKLEYFQRAGEAVCKLLWSTPTNPKQPIPESQLYSAPESGPATPPTDTESALVPQVWDGTEANDHGGSPTSTPTITSPSPGLTPTLTGTRLVEVVAGSDPVARLGRWEVDDTSLYAVDRRGWVEYELSAPSANLFRVEVEGASHNPFDLDPGFYLIASVDDEYLGRVLLDAMPGQTGTAQVLAPWLKPGPHRFRFFWDNVRKGRSLQIKAVRLQALLGPDTNGNGVIDWVENRLARENGIGLAPLVPTNQPADSAPVEISSVISPACLEGRGAFLGLMKIRLADGSEIQPRPGAGDRWYANVPLASDMPTEVQVSFQNGGRVERCRITWKRTDLLQAQELVVRQGDSLLLTASPESAPPAELMQATSQIALGATVQYAGPATGACPQPFEQGGVFTMTGTYALDSSQTRTVNIQVLSGALTGQPVVWTGKPRFLDLSGLPPEAVPEADPRVQFAVQALPDSGKRLRVVLDQPEDRSLVARLSATGPILASATIRGLNIYGVSESGVFYGQKYEDGSCLVETAVAQTRVFPDVTVELRIIVAGVMFEDGSLTKTLRATDFDQAGLANLSFIMPPGVQTSNCHVMRAYQNEAFLGEY